MPESPYADLSRRERQIMEVLYQAREASAEAIRAALPNPPSNSAVRATLRILEDKGEIAHRRDGRRYLYRPVTRPEHARRSALRHLTQTLFGGSVPKTVAALLSAESLSEDDLDALSDLIDRARSDHPDASS
jgi:predicted transcriptional regulator